VTTSRLSTLTRGLVAGALGTTALDTVGYLDMALTGRPASDAPGRTVLALAGRAGADLPDDASRRSAYGQLGGLTAGLAVGVGASVLRRLGLRLPAPVGIVATGAAAMAATDGPLALAGVADPRRWSAGDWARDAWPHLAFGAAAHWTLTRFEDEREAEQRPVTVGSLLRSTALGAATGSRASMSVLAPALAGGGTARVALTTGLAGAELVADKLPVTPSRLEVPGQLSRLGAGALGGAALAAREDRSPWLPALAGVLGASAGAVLGAAWREAAEDRGWTWQGALVEDAVALGLVGLAVRGSD